MRSARTFIRATAATMLLTPLLAGCGSSGGQASSSGAASSGGSASSSAQASGSAPSSAPVPAKSGKNASVTISNYVYKPPQLTVKAGARVTFANQDSTAHTATAASGFDTGTINPGGRATVTLGKPGTYSYICQFHAFMKGTITVTG